MAATEQSVDLDKLNEFVFRAVDEVGATLNAALVVMGDKLGLYKALAGAGPLTPVELARRSGASERYVREWLNAQAAGGYVEYDPAAGSYTLPPEQTIALTDEASPAFLPGFFQLALGSVIDSPRITEVARSGEGVGWHEHNHDVFDGCERFFRPGYNAALVPDWLPALDGVVEKLEAGVRVADLGCGHGSSTILMAQAFPNSTFVGSDYHAGSENDDGYALVTMFDCLHDMGDPVGAARQVRRMLEPDGTWLIVEPMAGDRVEDNLNPVGRLYYSASVAICLAHGHSEGRHALGAQAGEARLTEVCRRAGLTRVRRAAATPFNLILEARP